MRLLAKRNSSPITLIYTRYASTRSLPEKRPTEVAATPPQRVGGRGEGRRKGILQTNTASFRYTRHQRGAAGGGAGQTCIVEKGIRTQHLQSVVCLRV